MSALLRLLPNAGTVSKRSQAFGTAIRNSTAHSTRENRAAAYTNRRRGIQIRLVKHHMRPLPRGVGLRAAVGEADRAVVGLGAGVAPVQPLRTPVEFRVTFGQQEATSDGQTQDWH